MGREVVGDGRGSDRASAEFSLVALWSWSIVLAATPQGSSPELPACDLVLKGGVTSAVIYARFLHKLSLRYRFKRIGGTSAGAIGAAAGAIAQLARDRGDAGSFERLSRLPDWLGEPHPLGGSRLLNLFQPSAATQRLFRVVAAAVDGDRKGSWLGRGVAALWSNFFGAALLASLPGLWLVASALVAMVRDGASIARIVTFVVGLVVALVFAGAGVLLAALLGAVRGLSANNFGLCTGMPIDASRRDALTVWLHDYYNGLLGRGIAQPPVTFGELWGAAATASTRSRAIDLQVITTALNLKRPFRVPGDGGENPLRSFFYDPDEWARYFPAEVLGWLKEHRRTSKFAGRLFSIGGVELLPLPEPGDLPVIVAARLSLSFPVLLSAVPMYMIDWTREHNQRARNGAERLVPSKLYFSDGGISSNFPIHLFDAPLPGHPTFGVNLTDLHPDASTPVWRPDLPSGGVTQYCPEFDRSDAWHSLFEFAASILDSARTWRDTLQQTMPGFRDRIVHIGQAPDEGGLNLGMTPPVIARLGGLGEQAADTIVDAFAPRPSGVPTAWDTHRWIRMRSTLCMSEGFLGDLDAGLSTGRPPYAALPLSPAPHYPFDAKAARAACDFMQQIAALVASERLAPRLCDGAPKPRPALRITPSW